MHRSIQILATSGLALGLCICPFFKNAAARSLGTMGASFPVAEQSLLELIESKVAALTKSGGLKELEQIWVKQVARNADRPQPLNLPRVSISSNHIYKPEVVLTQNIVNAQGQILQPAGLKINALDQLPTYNPCWLFFNGDDQAQLSWAAKTIKQPSCPNPTLILTGGSVYQAEKALDAEIYFDQAGQISAKLVITGLPALVTRKNNKLLISQINITEAGDEIL